MKFQQVDEYIFGPMNTFVYLDEDELMFTGRNQVQKKLLDYLEKKPIDYNDRFRVEWSLEDSQEFKGSKGVFSPPGKETSFIVASIVGVDSTETAIPIEGFLPSCPIDGPLRFESVRFYFYGSGVGTCSVHITFKKNDGLTILDLENLSEQVNTSFKECFEEIGFEITKAYVKAVEKLNIPHHGFAFLPDIEEIDRSTHMIPYTHRIYHVEDSSLFNLPNPGEPFQFLLTPSRKMDVEDLSIYDNRYVYFGWGHSVIFTSGHEDGYSQTARPVYDYVRLVEIAQSQWQFLDVLADIVTYSISSFERHYKRMGMSELQEAIEEIRIFENGINRILSDYRGVKITFDTEKRILLNELHERWLTNNLLDNLRGHIERVTDLMDQLYQRQKEQREEALNTIALLFTIVGIIEVIALIIDLTQPIITLTPFAQITLVGIGTVAVSLLIMLYLRLAGRG